MKRAPAVTIAWLLGVASAPARADTPALTPAPASTTDFRAEARELAERGDAQFDAGRCDKAILLWKEAEARFHAPTILLRIARCQALVGKVVAAAATLAPITREAVDATAPTAFADAKLEAEREIKSVRARIATLKIKLDKPGTIAVAPTLEIDDTHISGEAAELAVDPGRHLIRVHAADVLWERALTLDDGETQDVHIALSSERPPPPLRRQRQIGLILGGVGGVSIVVGVGFAASAFATSQQLGAACGPGRGPCPASEQGSIDRLKAHTHAADITLGAGAALLAAGAILLLTEPGPKEEPPRIRVSASAWTFGPGRSTSPASAIGLSIAGTY